MTKFDSVQISHRKGKQASTYTTAELRKNMAIYKATGVHPELSLIHISEPTRPY